MQANVYMLYLVEIVLNLRFLLLIATLAFPTRGYDIRYEAQV